MSSHPFSRGATLAAKISGICLRSRAARKNCGILTTTISGNLMLTSALLLEVIALFEREFIGAEDVALAQQWLVALERVGYDFPLIT